MARTINFRFTQGGGAVITSGTLTLAPTENWSAGGTTVVPSGDPVQLVNGEASIPSVTPTPAAEDGWRYQVTVETPDRKTHMWIVEVPDGTTPINFDELPVVMSMTLPLGSTGVQLRQWIDSVHSHAAAANTNAVNALAGVADLNDVIDDITGGGTGGGSIGRVNYAVGATTPRPSTNPGVLVFWIADSPPANALPGDVWLNAPS